MRATQRRDLIIRIRGLVNHFGDQVVHDGSTWT